MFFWCVFLDLRRLYFQAGVENKPTLFLFTDTQVVSESFLEDINNILSSGEVPNLYKPDEFEEVRMTEKKQKSEISKFVFFNGWFYTNSQVCRNCHNMKQTRKWQRKSNVVMYAYVGILCSRASSQGHHYRARS